jgi:hypothetical protein
LPEEREQNGLAGVIHLAGDGLDFRVEWIPLHCALLQWFPLAGLNQHNDDKIVEDI